MPRFEYREGGARKFWEISLAGASFTTRYGRIGTPGQEIQRDFHSAAAAQRELERLIREKLRVGFERVESEERPSAGVQRNAELEAAIAATPDDPAPCRVYADWLQAQGDPRGELMAIQCVESAEKAQTRELQEREQALISRHLGAWLGVTLSDADEAVFDLTWRFGFVRKARLRFREEANLEILEALSKLLGSPVTGLLEELTVGKLDPDGAHDFEDVVGVLADKAPPHLSTLTLKDARAGGDVSALWEATPRLRRLKLKGEGFVLGDIAAPELRKFTLHAKRLTVAHCEAIGAAKWPHLRKLELRVAPGNGWATQRGQCRVGDLAPIFEGRGLSRLTHLGLQEAGYADELVEPLALSPILKQLETLDLSGGHLSDDGVDTMIRHSDAFKHLKELDISENMIEVSALGRVRSICAVVKDDNQRRDRGEREDRYDEIGE